MSSEVNMPTTQADIRRWLEDAREEGATHVIVVRDTFDYGDYPVSVTRAKRMVWLDGFYGRNKP